MECIPFASTFFKAKSITLRFVASTRCIIAQIKTALFITHANDQMLEICRVIGQILLTSTICGIAHHARRTRAHCQTMVLSFKLPSGTVCLPRFCCRVGHIERDKSKIFATKPE